MYDGSFHAINRQFMFKDHLQLRGGRYRCVQSGFHLCPNISEWTLKTLQANLAQYIVSPPRHGSEGTMPWNALPADEVEEVKMFIQSNATVNGLPQPAAPRGHNKQAPTYLPCVTTKKQVHAEHSKGGGQVAYSTFAKLWSKECQDIVIMLPNEGCVRNLC